MIMQHTALVLNADYQPLSYFPLSTWSFDRTLRNVMKQRVTVVEEYDTILRSQKWEYRPPSVVALNKYVKRPDRVPFTRFNVFLRDGFHCQYCNEKHKPSDLTFDHVVPRAKGGTTCWNNIVAACRPCNTDKDTKIIKPIRLPREPSTHELMAVQRRFPPNFLHEDWRSYLYWDVELEP